MKKKILIPLIALILVLILTFSVSSCINSGIRNPSSSNNNNLGNPNNNADIQNPDDNVTREPYDYTNSIFLVDALFKNFSMFDIDYETAMLAAIRAYVEATGDKYAMFYTPEEFAEIEQEDNGDLYGIGVQVIFDYEEYFIEIILTMPNSPAQSTLLVGDKITHILIDGQKISLVDLVLENIEKSKKIYPNYTEEEINNIACYETLQYAVSKLKGPVGTYAEFTIDRNGNSIDMKVQRAKVKTLSVTAKTSTKDPTVGIVSISQFDLTTPTQFKDCMDSLIAQGCDKFVFDVRNNPGGIVASVTAVLSTLLPKDTVLFSTKDYLGTVETFQVKPVDYSYDPNYSTCSVTNDDIGKYAGYEFVVLANENSASSAEIFTAALRDNNIAQIVGVNTYGKGSVQSVIPLDYYNQNGTNYYGALKLTTKLHFPPCGIGYDGGIGIAPNYTVELEGIATETHFYKLTEEIDNQLQKAVSVLID